MRPRLRRPKTLFTPISNATICRSRAGTLSRLAIDLAPGAVASWRLHLGEEVIYIIEGTLEYQLEGEAPVTLQGGDVLFVPAGVARMERNRTASNGAELATYIVDKGKPLLVSVDDKR